MSIQTKLQTHISYLKNILYKNKISQLSANIESDAAGEFIDLFLIKIKPSQQNKGYGAAVMDSIISFADTYNVRIKIQLNTYVDKTRLIEFYRKHKFVLIKNGDFDMVYYPEKKKINKIVTN